MRIASIGSGAGSAGPCNHRGLLCLSFRRQRGELQNEGGVFTSSTLIKCTIQQLIKKQQMANGSHSKLLLLLSPALVNSAVCCDVTLLIHSVACVVVYLMSFEDASSSPPFSWLSRQTNRHFHLNGKCGLWICRHVELCLRSPVVARRYGLIRAHRPPQGNSRLIYLRLFEAPQAALTQSSLWK